jgi:hydrogenase nickel incorporation protein HypA/HybF
MHELSIVFEVIDQVEKIAKENNIEKVTGLTLELGEVSTVIPDYFRDCFSWAIKKSEYMKECVLDIVVLEAESFCKDCKKTYSTTKYGKECPYCHKENTYLLSGEEISIRDIKVVDKKE